MEKYNFRKRYKGFVQALKGRHAMNQAMSLAVGGNFDAVGILERELLIQHGLKKDDYIIDVGCGSGRLGKALSEYLEGEYLGIDVVPDLIEHARSIVGKKDWRFEVTDGLFIPEEDNKADMVCFFSVFTHLLHQQSYNYLCEAKRVLKPGGKIIFSFLDFKIPDHWFFFESALSNTDSPEVLIMFLNIDAIKVWSLHLNLIVSKVLPANKPHIPLPHPIKFDDGSVIKGKGKLGPIGQSVCVLVKPT
jgi:ubiquinone/menaquinone biosynthesis C-methylase UbiE